MAEYALAVRHRMVTGSRPLAVAGRVACEGASRAARFVRTHMGLALFDERGRYVGTVEALLDEPRFGPAAETVFLRR